MSTRCANPRATKRVFNTGHSGPMAWCPGCKSHKPAEQVSWANMLRNAAGEITATYAPIPHQS